jgi:hypothetical protein
MTIPQAREIAVAPLPQPEPCSDRHFIQCIRVLLAALPKRNSDDVSGELLIAAYQRKLGSFSKGQINYLSDKALERCEWFPTIAECLGIIGEWKRDDDLLRLQERAKGLVFSDRERRFRAVMGELAAGAYSQAQIDALPDSWKVVGETRGHLRLTEDGGYVSRIGGDGKPVAKPKPKEPAAQVGPTCRKCHDLGRVLDLEGDEVDCPDCAPASETQEVAA